MKQVLLWVISMSSIIMGIVPVQAKDKNTNQLLEQSRIQTSDLSRQEHYLLTTEKSDFGAYKVEHQLALVPQSIAAVDYTTESLGTMSVVKSARPIKRVVEGTLARNVLTNKLAPISGNITVLLAKDVTLDNVVQATGLSVVSSYSGTQLAVLKVPANEDVLIAAKQLKALDLVVQTKIEVLDVVYESY
ncbi:hypothetical protein [uncultured Shewanella sp.]|uniref:S8 family serine peptidase n=1 Tax=uncultured Shewanella sp. TaxID=173975 RepID=UPI0026056B8F|nr:hypothetical protein [uncultured Shewanella sp.]